MRVLASRALLTAPAALVALACLACEGQSVAIQPFPTMTPAFSEPTSPTPVPTPTPTDPPPPPTPTPTPDPITAYENATMAEIDNLLNLGRQVTAQCSGAAQAGCRPAFVALQSASAAATNDFNTRPYPPCMVGYRTVLISTAVGYHNATIQGLGALESHGLYGDAPALSTIVDEEHVITQTSLLETPLDCSPD